MTALFARRPFNITEYYKLLDSGILTEDDRIELIDGEIIKMSPIGPRHTATVKRLNAFLVRKMFGLAIIGVQDPIHLNQFSAPQPDISILTLRDDFYASGHPTPEDILVAIEVSDSTLDYDRQIKLPNYAQAGIPEAWLIDLVSDRIEIHSQPNQGIYQEVRIILRHQQIVSRILPQLELNAEEILG